MAPVILGLLLPALVGFVCVTALWPARRRPDSAFLLKACLGFGWGLGVASWGYFLWLLLAGSPGRGLFLAEAVAGVVLLAAFAVVLLRTRQSVEPVAVPSAWGKLPLFLTAVFALVVLARVAQFLMMTHVFPYGQGDAYFIWNLKARFLYRGGEDWQLIFAFPQSPGGAPLAPPDYPLSLPSGIARAWLYRGAETTNEPAIVHLLFLVGGYLLLFSAVAALRGVSQGALAGLLLAANDPYAFLAAAQLADVPFSFFVLAAVVPFALSDAHRAGQRTDRPAGCPNDRAGQGAGLSWVVLAGMMAGLAGWVKNEGLMFVIVLAAVRFVVVVLRDGFRAYARELAAFALGLLPFLALLLYYRFALAPPSYLFLGQDGQAWGRITDPERWKPVFGSFLVQLLPLGRHSMSGLGYVLPMLPVYALLLGRARSPARRAALAPVLVVPLVLAGYTLVYLVTPVDLGWHLASSLHRLMLHVWPVALFAFFVAVANPEERISAGEPPAGEPNGDRP